MHGLDIATYLRFTVTTQDRAIKRLLCVDIILDPNSKLIAIIELREDAA